MASLAHGSGRTLAKWLGSFDRRSHRRSTIRLDGLVSASPGRHRSVKVVDISATGCRLRDRKHEYEIGDWLTFSLDGEVVVEGVVRWWNDYQCGVEFLSPLPEAMLDTAA